MIFFLVFVLRKQSNKGITIKMRLKKKGFSKVPFKEDYKTRCCKNTVLRLLQNKVLQKYCSKAIAKQGVAKMLF